MENKLKNQLPVHNPPDAVWEQISKKINPLWAQTGYAPPESVWQGIEAQLNAGRVVGFVPKRWWYAAAAAVVAAILGVFGWLNNPNGSQEKITYSEEKLSKPLITKTSGEVNRQFAQIEAYCAVQVVACQKPAFRNLKRQLDELNSAHQQLKNVVETYNPDPVLVAQFDRIENARADVLRQLSEQI